MVGIAWIPILMNLLGGIMGGGKGGGDQGAGVMGSLAAMFGGGGAQTGGPLAAKKMSSGLDPLRSLQSASNYDPSKGPVPSQGGSNPLSGLQQGGNLGGGGYQPVKGGGGNVLGALSGMLENRGGRGVHDPNWLANMAEKPGGAGGGVIFLPRHLSAKQQRLQAIANIFAPMGGGSKKG